LIIAVRYLPTFSDDSYRLSHQGIRPGGHEGYSFKQFSVEPSKRRIADASGGYCQRERSNDGDRSPEDEPLPLHLSFP
jgi:hypothetical protein